MRLSWIRGLLLPLLVATVAEAGFLSYHFESLPPLSITPQRFSAFYVDEPRDNPRFVYVNNRDGSGWAIDRQTGFAMKCTALRIAAENPCKHY